MARKFLGVLQGHGNKTTKNVDRSLPESRWQLPTRKLPMGYQEAASGDSQEAHQEEKFTPHQDLNPRCKFGKLVTGT
jgi:hypothetical protein